MQSWAKEPVMRRKAISAAAEDLWARGFINRFSIGRRLALCFAGIFVLLLAENSILLWRFHSAHVGADRRLTGVSLELIAVLNLQSSLQAFNDRLDRVAQSQDAVLLRQESGSLREMILDSVQETRNAITHLPPEVRPYPTLVPTLLAIESTLPSQLESLNSLAASGDWSALRLRLANEKRPLDAETSMLVKSITRELNDELGQTVTNIAHLERQMVIVLPLTALGALIIASLVGLIITRSITTPLGRLMEGSSALSRGEFDHVVPISGQDELARLGRVFNDTAGKLRSLYETLQESKAKLEEAQRIAHVGYWEWDLATNRVIWSDETYRIYGLQPQEYPIDIAVLQKMIHPEDLEFVFRVAEEAIRKGLRTDAEHRIIRPSGELRTVHSQGDLKKDASGRPCQMFGTVQDITERKRAEQRLSESEAYLAEAQRLSQTGSWAWNPATGDIRYWSEMCYRVLGFDPAGPLPRFEEFFRRIHPDDQAAVRERFEKAIRDKADFELDYRVVHPEKGIRDIHVVGHAVLDGSSLLEFVGTVIDVTERKRAEEALQQNQFYLAEGQRLARMGSWAFDATGFNYWSSELFQIYGLDPRGKPPTIEEYLALVHPEDRAFMKQGIAKMLDDHLAFDFTKRIVRPDGEIRQVRCVGVPVTQGGTFQGFLGTGMDVTEQERLTEELRLSENYLSEGQRLAHMGSWAFNPSGFFEYWSQELFKIYGLDPQKGGPTLEQYLATVHPLDRDFMADTIKKMTAAHSGCDVKQRIVRPDGEQRYIRCVGIPVVEGDVLKGFLGTAIDITEQELLTRELERRQAYLAEAQKLTHTGSWAINVRTDEHFWSEEMFRIHEIDPKVKPSWSLIRERVHPDDRASLDQRKKMEFTQTGWADSEADLRIVLPDGRIKHLHTIAHPVMDASGQIIEVIGTTMDVTDRKRVEDSLRRSESHLAEAQRLTHTASWAWRLPDRKAVHLSTEWYRIYDFDPAQGAPTWEEYFGRLHPEDRLTLKNTIECAIMEKADYDLEFRVLLPNGMVKWLHTVGHPVLSDGGDLEQFAGSSTDITERKSAEQEREKLRQLEADLAHTNRVSTLGEMAASLAHEIKQPIAAAITSANSCIEWLAHDPPNLDRARAAAARIDKYGNRAAEIIDRIRSFYKKSPPQRELVDVNGIIQEILTLLTGEAMRFSIAMRTDLSGELPKIMVDRVQLQQVFMNLMLNGIEAMGDSGGELTVKSELQNGQLQFSVSDTGVGLPPEKMDQIFSAFFTTKPQGSGMGLAISRSIVESHGGQLWASANNGEGATFHFTLPTQVAESSPVFA
jgi:PAS domain S-box-containing protein